MKRRPQSILTALLRLFFYHFYRSLSWSYDLVAWIVSVGQWNDWVRSCLPFVQGPTILELGHGPGHLQVTLGRMGWKVFGIDESKQMGKLAYRRIKNVGRKSSPASVNPGEPLISRASATAMPFPDETFQSVVATFPTEYIFHPDTLSEVTRVLKPGGRLMVLLSASIVDRRLIHRFFSWLFRITGETREWDDLPSKVFSRTSLSFSSRWLLVRTSQVYMITAEKPGKI